MTPLAFLALWNGVVPGRQAEYEAWHSMEHVPERLGAPGFRAARRYRAEGGDGYFTLYELDGLESLDTPDYLALVRDPTPWSARMRKTLTDFRRLPCRTVAAQRFGQGGAVATMRILAQEAATTARLRAIMGEAVKRGHTLGFTLGEAEQFGQSYEAFPQAPSPRSETLVVAEATEIDSLAPVIQACRELVGASRAEVGLWRLLQILGRSDLKDASLPRQMPRDDLRVQWE